MSQMVRKQIYLSKKQEERLKLLARTMNVSEAELIRQALDSELIHTPIQLLNQSRLALDELIRFAISRRQVAEGQEPYHWKREDAYGERGEKSGP